MVWEKGKGRETENGNRRSQTSSKREKSQNRMEYTDSETVNTQMLQCQIKIQTINWRKRNFTNKMGCIQSLCKKITTQFMDDFNI